MATNVATNGAINVALEQQPSSNQAAIKQLSSRDWVALKEGNSKSAPVRASIFSSSCASSSCPFSIFSSLRRNGPKPSAFRSVCGHTAAGAITRWQIRVPAGSQCRALAMQHRALAATLLELRRHSVVPSSCIRVRPSTCVRSRPCVADRAVVRSVARSIPSRVCDLSVLWLRSVCDCYALFVILVSLC